MHQIQMLGLLELDVLSGIEVPFLPETDSAIDGVAPSQEEADEFDLDIFALNPESKLLYSNRDSFVSTGSTNTTHRISDKRIPQQRESVLTPRITPIEESPKPTFKELSQEESPPKSQLQVTFNATKRSPSTSSIHSLRSNLSASSKKSTSHTTPTRGLLTSKLAPSWLFNPFRSGPSEPQTTTISASASSLSHVSASATPLVKRETVTPPPSTPSATVNRSPSKLPPSPIPHRRSPLPMTIRKPATTTRTSTSRTFEEDSGLLSRSPLFRRSPMGTPPRDEATFGKRRSVASIHTLHPSAGSSSSPVAVCNPSQPQSSMAPSQASLARRWQHMYPQVLHKHNVKWKAMTTPACLPLTVEQFPSTSELELLYDVFSYDFVLIPDEMHSFLVRPPVMKGSSEDVRRMWALAVMRGMAAVRLAQGFQFVLRRGPQAGSAASSLEKVGSRRSKPLMAEEEMTPKPVGAADVLRWGAVRGLIKSTSTPVYLSMTNEIHRISFTGEAIQVRRYVRRMPPSPPVKYECLMWPKLGGEFFFRLKWFFLAHWGYRWVHRDVDHFLFAWLGKLWMESVGRLFALQSSPFISLVGQSRHAGRRL